ncbi:MAG: serine protease [Pseudomonadota bacterium]|nr:serine protease [Pseudomonadota bacterium]
MKAVVMVAMLLLAGCGPKPVGADRDRHGCLGSAGYQWCPTIQECVRSWELAEERGLANTPEAVEAFCAGEEGGA